VCLIHYDLVEVRCIRVRPVVQPVKKELSTLIPSFSFRLEHAQMTFLWPGLRRLGPPATDIVEHRE